MPAGGSQQASIVVEFIFAIPILVSLVLLTSIVNEYLERRQTLQIAARNAASASVDLRDEAVKRRRASLEKDFFGAKTADLQAANSDDLVRVIRDGDLTNAMAQTPCIPSGSVTAMLAIEGDLSPCDPKQSQPSQGGDNYGPFHNRIATSYDGRGLVHDVAAAVGTVAGATGPIVHESLNFIFMFNHNDRIDVTKATMTVPVGSEFFTTTLMKLVASARQQDEKTYLDAERSKGVSFNASLFNRRFVSYHPSDTYEWQGLIGYALGDIYKPADADQWGYVAVHKRNIAELFKPVQGGFVENCMFFYMADVNCGPYNNYATVVDTLARVSVIVDTIAKLTPGGAAKSGVNEAIKIGIKSLLSDFEKNLEKKIEDKIAADLHDKMNAVTNGVKDQVEQALDGVEANALSRVTDMLDPSCVPNGGAACP